MNTWTNASYPPRCLWLTLAVVLTVQAPLYGQGQPDVYDFLHREPVLPRDLGISASGNDSPLLCRSASVRLFRMPTALPFAPLGLDLDADSPDEARMGCECNANGDGRMLVSMGTDNPFFDFRRPGDPGGVGYFKLHSQYLLVDTPASGISLGLQAVTPAGLEAAGISQGPTILSPSLACYYDLGGGTGIHGYFGKRLRSGAGWPEGLQRDMRYGLAFQSPFPGLARESSPPPVYLFVEALGRNRFVTDPNARPTANWELVPGIQWRVGDNWLLSGGLLMPLGTPRPDSRLWQISCSWQF